jgi:hypothetical protein
MRSKGQGDMTPATKGVLAMFLVGCHPVKLAAASMVTKYISILPVGLAAAELGNV